MNKDSKLDLVDFFCQGKLPGGDGLIFSLNEDLFMIYTSEYLLSLLVRYSYHLHIV